ncbi:AP-3 complex subunit delta-1 [Neocloeon triangulifer]|uniref:AP-3 complex subunit delta-1 n=1 Tax=Neocloeon triangulifer TaxID=2078957 RepID=UPI00286F7427|nr:AP-3 complex subunit delta-1 [Neocloeon triangulifer]
MALRKVKGNLERMFDKNLTDLVRGIRNNKENEAKFIAQCIEEIKQELRQENISVKANAVAKLTYLQMMGYDVSWAGFNVIEVMSSTKFTYKRIGYLAASQTFHPDTGLLMLTTNMVRKDLNSQSQYEAGLALSGLSCFISPDLARDLANDIMTLLSSTRPYLRKKAVLMMYKVFLRFPEALRPAFPRLKEKLEDPDSGVQSAAVNVVCELARKNPKNYLSLAPVFFKLMTTSTNNWMLIKIIKLFGALTPLEPRLGKKLIEPLTNLIHSTSAMSLLYECINTVIAVLISISSGMPNHSTSIQLCVQKLRILIEDSDQNLKYLGLLAMSKILKTHPKSVQSHKDLILQCLDDKDESIRLRALDLLYGMVSKKNLMEIVKKLMIHMDKAEGTSYRDELLSKIVEICSQNNYQHITNFEWYVSVLVELTRMEGTKHGPLVANQLLDVAIRVSAIRSFVVAQMALLLDNAHFITGFSQRASMCEVLYAAAWICGEFSEFLPDTKSTLEALLRARVSSLPGHIQAVYVQNIMKLYGRLLTANVDDANIDSDMVAKSMVEEISELVAGRLPSFVESSELEVQERASVALQLVKFVQKQMGKGQAAGLGAEIVSLFDGELNPVAPKAQKKVQVPEGLDLDEWINEPPPSESSDSEPEIERPNLFSAGNAENSYSESYQGAKPVELTQEELQKHRDARKFEQASNPNYLKGGTSESKSNYIDVSEVPVAQLDLPVSLKIPGLVSSDHYLKEQKEKVTSKKKVTKKKKKSKKSKESSDEEELATPLHVVNTDVGEMPEGASLSDGQDDENNDSNDPHRALDINLDEPLRAEEKLPVRSHREAPPSKLEVVGLKDEGSKKNKKKSLKKEDKKEKTKKSKKEKSVVMDLIQNGEHPNPPANEPSTDFWLDHADYEAMPDTSMSKSLLEEQENGKTKKKSCKSKEKTKDKKKRKEKNVIKSEDTDSLATDIASLSVEPSFVPNFVQVASNKDKTVSISTLPQLSGSQLLISVTVNNTTVSPLRSAEISFSKNADLELIPDGLKTTEFGSYRFQQEFPPGCLTFPLLFNVANVNSAYNVKATVIFNLESNQDKIDLAVNVPSALFLKPMPISGSDFAEKLASGDMQHLTSKKFQTKKTFKEALGFCMAIFCLVEQIGDTASLSAQTPKGQQVFLLLKSQGGTLSLDGKSDNQELIENVVQWLQQVLSA